MVVLAAMLATVPWAWGAESGRTYAKLALFLLITACPCALVISTPVTYVAALTRGARLGILVKGGEHLESLGKLDILALDKTGTLTNGLFAVSNFLLVGQAGGGDREKEAQRMAELLQMVLSVEQHSEHALAMAVRKCGQDLGLHARPVQEWRAVEGEGVQAVVGAVPGGGKMPHSKRRREGGRGEGGGAMVGGQGGTFFAVGNAKMMARLSQESEGEDEMWGVGLEGTGGAEVRHSKLWRQLARERATVLAWEERGETTAWVWVGPAGDRGGARRGGVVGVISAVDAPRNEARKAVSDLLALGVECVVLTGDSHATSSAAVKRISGAEGGIAEMHAELLPADKVSHLKRLRGGRQGSGGSRERERVVGMLGDGVNDSPALAFATLGIAMGKNGAAAAVEAADMALMRDDLGLVPTAVSLGRQVLRKVSQNLSLSIGSKVCVTAAAFCGYAWLWLAILTDLGTMIVVTLNGASLLRAEIPGGGGVGVVEENCEDEVVLRKTRCEDDWREKVREHLRKQAVKG